jgi:hypothetical protein
MGSIFFSKAKIFDFAEKCQYFVSLNLVIELNNICRYGRFEQVHIREVNEKVMKSTYLKKVNNGIDQLTNLPRLKSSFSY